MNYKFYSLWIQILLIFKNSLDKELDRLKAKFSLFLNA